MDISVLFAAFWIILIAEITGDKSLFTITSLTMRLNTWAVLLGLSAAFMLKMLVAVLIGQALTELPIKLLTVITIFTFFATALVLWFRREEVEDAEQVQKSVPRSIAVSFASIFFIEWGDIGQITAAALTAQSNAPLMVWLGASLALITKGVLAITLGGTARRFLPQNFLRLTAVGVCLILGIASIVQLARL